MNPQQPQQQILEQVRAAISQQAPKPFAGPVPNTAPAYQQMQQPAQGSAMLAGQPHLQGVSHMQL